MIGGAAAGGRGAVIGALAGAAAGTAGAYLTGKREIVVPAETLLTFHVNSVSISPKELARLQRVMPNELPSVETQTVIVRGRHHGDDDDDDENEVEYEHEADHEHYHEHHH